MTGFNSLSGPSPVGRLARWWIGTQASAFEDSCRVFAPSYRQMCLGAFPKVGLGQEDAAFKVSSYSNRFAPVRVASGLLGCGSAWEVDPLPPPPLPPPPFNRAIPYRLPPGMLGRGVRGRS